VAIAPQIQVTSHTSATSWWEMARVMPPTDLSSHILGCLGYAEQHDGVLHRREVPMAGIPVILGFGDDPYEIETFDSPTPHVTAAAFMAGMHDSHSITTQRGPQRGIQLDLTPLGAYQLFGLPMREVSGHVLALDEILGREAPLLVEQLAEGADWSARFETLEVFLRKRLEEAPPVDRAVAWAWSQLELSGGGVRVADLADEIGWSRRHFASRFATQVGLPPKAVARVLRFRKATDLLGDPSRAGGRLATLADVAAACGYSDHSHFDRDFRALAGCTPTQYVASTIPGGGGIVA
jgi:AraC-like DNA-binding protein